MDKRQPNLTDRDIDDLIGSLCAQRMYNPDVEIMDRIQKDNDIPQFKDEFEEEKYHLNKECQDIENDIINDLATDIAPLNFEQMQADKAQRIYEAYKSKQKQKEESGGTDIMSEMVRELQDEINRENAMGDDTNNIPVVTAEEVVESDYHQFQDSLEITDGVCITTNENIPEEVKEEVEENDMTEEEIENFNDVPATEIEVSDEELTDKVKTIIGSGESINDNDVIRILDIVKRYKNGEKFSVYNELPTSFKQLIDQAAMEAGVTDIRYRNYFAKNFINELVSDIFLSKEIKNFEDEMAEIHKQMGNIPGMVVDSYSDEIGDKYIGLRDIADKIENEDHDKAEKLRAIAQCFEDTFTLKRIFDEIEKNPSFVNRNYKRGRDSYNRMVEDFNETFADVKPKVKSIEIVHDSLAMLGYDEEIVRTVVSMIYSSIMSSAKELTIETHIYAYYLILGFNNLIMTSNNSKYIYRLHGSIMDLIDKNNEIMASLRSTRPVKKKGGKKKNRRK
jgi:esterase/lipase